MTPLQRQALASLPMSEQEVERIYTTSNDGEGGGSLLRKLAALCVSHERLRMEIEGATLLLDKDQYTPAPRIEGQ
jgi:hypothetical protein